MSNDVFKIFSCFFSEKIGCRPRAASGIHISITLKSTHILIYIYIDRSHSYILIYLRNTRFAKFLLQNTNFFDIHSLLYILLYLLNRLPAAPVTEITQKSYNFDPRNKKNSEAESGFTCLAPCFELFWTNDSLQFHLICNTPF